MGETRSPESVAETLRQRLPGPLQHRIWLGWLSDWLATPPGRALADLAAPLAAARMPQPLAAGGDRPAADQPLGDRPADQRPLPDWASPTTRGRTQAPGDLPDSAKSVPGGLLAPDRGPGSVGEPNAKSVPGGERWVVAVCPLGYDPQRPFPPKLLLASSRIGAWEGRPELAAAVRSLMVHLDGSPAELVTGHRMTCRDLSFHVSHLFGRRGWEWVPPASTRWSTWLRRLLTQIASHSLDTHWGRLYLSPPLPATQLPHSPQLPQTPQLPSAPNLVLSGPAVPALSVPEGIGANAVAGGENEWPLPDQLAFASAHQVYVLSVRPGGHTWSLAARLAGQSPTAGRIHVFVSSDLPKATSAAAQDRRHARQLMQQGAIGWYLIPADPSDPPSKRVPAWADRHSGGTPGTIRQLRPGDAARFFVHHTRGSPGPFAARPGFEFWWRWLMFDTPAATAFDVLLRIVCQRRLRAAGRLIPGQVPVICFSARCPVESVAQRTFRPHLRRWDYEPYGVAIDRQWLAAAGAQPVEYLEGSEPTTPFQQVRYSRSSRDQPVDWSAEQEHRLVGDLDLRRLPAGRLFWFVRTRAEAEQIAGFTHQPVKYLVEDVR